MKRVHLIYIQTTPDELQRAIAAGIEFSGATWEIDPVRDGCRLLVTEDDRHEAGAISAVTLSALKVSLETKRVR